MLLKRRKSSPLIIITLTILVSYFKLYRYSFTINQAHKSQASSHNHTQYEPVSQLKLCIVLSQLNYLDLV